MATERLSMRKTREILRQKLELGRSHREVAASVGLSVGAVGATLVRAAAAGLSWASVQGLSDEALDERLYSAKAIAARPLPDCAYIHIERKKPGVTLELLHLEYLERHPDGYRYTQFCERYREWLSRRGFTMRQEHIAREKCRSTGVVVRITFERSASGPRRPGRVRRVVHRRGRRAREDRSSAPSREYIWRKVHEWHRGTSPRLVAASHGACIIPVPTKAALGRPPSRSVHLQRCRE